MGARRLVLHRVMQLARERAPDGFADVHDLIAPDALEGTARHYERGVGFDKDVLGARASYSVRPPA